MLLIISSLFLIRSWRVFLFLKEWAFKRLTPTQVEASYNQENPTLGEVATTKTNTSMQHTLVSLKLTAL